MILGSKELIRDMNSTLVLETVISKKSISRAGLSKELGLTKATISTIIQDLIDRNLVIEIGSDNTGLGRKPILLTYNPKAGYALCIDIGVTQCRALLSNLQADIITDESFDTPKDVMELPAVLIQYITKVLKGLSPSTYGLTGITLSIHGVTKENKVIFAPYYDVSQLDLVTTLEEAFHLPIYIENEANLSALGENTFVYNNSNLASISIHSGIGLGLIMGNHLVKGYQGFSGEIGHTIVNINGLSCPCGNKGCLEQYVSQTALLKEFCRRKGIVHTSFIEFSSYYERGDSDAMAVMDTFIQYMTVGLNNILNTYNPEIVVINSKFTNYYPDLIEQIIANLSSRMNNYSSIIGSTLQDNSSLLGGLCITIRGFLGIKQLQLQNK